MTVSDPLSAAKAQTGLAFNEWIIRPTELYIGQAPYLQKLSGPCLHHPGSCQDEPGMTAGREKEFENIDTGNIEQGVWQKRQLYYVMAKMKKNIVYIPAETSFLSLHLLRLGRSATPRVWEQ